MTIPWDRATVITFAIEVAVIAAALLVAAIVMRRRGRAAFAARLRVSSTIAAAIAVLAVVATFTVAPTLPSPYVPLAAQLRPNPMADTVRNAEAGRALFQQNCVVCHGAAGRGDGPAAFALNPRPADLRLHVPQHTDGFLEYVIAEGWPGTAMPAWKGQLTEEERWQIVVYLRRLAAGEP